MFTFDRRGSSVVLDWQFSVYLCFFFTFAVGRFWLMTVVAAVWPGPVQPSGQNRFEHR